MQNHALHALWEDTPMTNQQWQPIETAPKDGTDLWLFCPNDYPQQVVGRWADSWGGWDWVEPIVSDMAEGEMQPTYWMPLPPPPETPK